LLTGSFSEEVLKIPRYVDPAATSGVLIREPRMDRGSNWMMGVVMKKIFGLLLTVSTLVLSAACASSGGDGKPQTTDSGDPIVLARPVEQPRGQESPTGSQDGLSASDASSEAATLR